MRAIAVLAVLIAPAYAGNPCVQTKTIHSNTVLVPATVGGHTNMLVAVPNTVAFSQIAVQVGVPVGTYGPVSYTPQPAGQGLAQPQNDELAKALNAINQRLARLEGKGGATAQGDSREAIDARVLGNFQQSCVSCHSAAAHKGGFRMFDDGGNLLPLPRAKVLARVKTDDEAKRMPKGGHQLPPEVLADIEKWATLPADAVW